MLVHRDILSFPTLPFPVVTTGTFDGVHLGHKTILDRVKEISHNASGQSVVVTFHPHPRIVLQPQDKTLKLLNSLDEKIRLLAEAGIDHLLIIPFSKEFSELDSAAFIQKILVDAVKTKILVIGYDHHFGKNREGSIQSLRDADAVTGFKVKEIPALDVDNVYVSSTKIRTALQSGDIETANLYLGYPYTMTGTVVSGARLGRQIGFPTANLEIADERKLIPETGVYAVKVLADGATYKGMLNIGYRPTVSTEMTLKTEVHILDFSGDLYDKEVRVDFYKRIRNEQKFDGIEALKAQLNADKLTVSELLKDL